MTTRRPPTGPPGFTLTDTAVSLMVGAVLILIVSSFLVDGQRSFTQAYGGVFGSPAQEALAARAVFRRTIRQACAGMAAVAADGRWIEVRYYSSPGVSAPDRAARFEVSGQDLHLRRSVLETGQTLSLETVCRNVVSVQFHLTGGSAQMFLTLDDGSSSQTVNTAAAMRSP
ncbi:MAG: hypothetical protein FJ280_09240 [Planctomycetes bacterium]|nr:hypothetical protein [Planctomycetota bacterium]